MWSQQRALLQLQWREQRRQEESIQSLCGRVTVPREFSAQCEMAASGPSCFCPASTMLCSYCCHRARAPCLETSAVPATLHLLADTVGNCCSGPGYGLRLPVQLFFPGAKCCMACSGLLTEHTLPGQPTSLWCSV